MNSAFVQPFIDATLNVFNSTIQFEPKIGQPEKAETIPTQPFCDASGITVGAEHEDFADAVGELVNMVAGNAKAKFDGKCVSISIPSVVIGSHMVAPPSDAVCISIPFNSAGGPFAVEVCLKKTGVNAAGKPASHGAEAA